MAVPAQFPTGRKCKLAFVGEAPGDQEVALGRPFCGPAGKLFNQLLRCAGIDRSECLVTNVFNEQLPNNDVKNWCVGVKDAVGDRAAIDRGKYLRPDKLYHLDRLFTELDEAQPNLVVPLGGTALWALTDDMASTVGKQRGVLRRGIGNCKLLPTFHPAFLFHSYGYFNTVVIDLMKAKVECETKDIEYTPRELWLEPSIQDIVEFKRRYLDSADYISIDIETIPAWRMISVVGFASDPHHAICIPFFDKLSKGRSYWPTEDGEVEAWKLVADICDMPQPKLGQNFTYDLKWLRDRGIFVRNACHDTRLQHHALYPELDKDLGFLGSVYAKERAWKGWGRGEKRDE